MRSAIILFPTLVFPSALSITADVLNTGAKICKFPLMKTNPWTMIGGLAIGSALQYTATQINAHLKENEEWSLMEVRAAKLAIEQYKDANGDLPPGINYRQERVVNIKRS